MSTSPLPPPPDDYRLLLEHVPQLVSKHNKAGMFLYAAPAYARLLGYPPADLTEHSIYDLIHPMDAAIIRNGYVRAWSQNTPQTVMCRMLRQDGQYVWLEMVLVPQHRESAVLVYGQDVSKVKYLEEVLRILARGTDAMRGLDFFRAMVSQVASAMRMPFAFITEHTNNKTHVRMLAFWKGEDFGNPFEYSLTGTPCDEVINQGKSCYFPIGVQSLFPDDRDLVALSAQGYIGVPITDSQDRVIGHLAVLDRKQIVIEDRELSILKIFAHRAGVELERMQAARSSQAVD
ncbi:MAG: PAS domain-containing protein [Anaerolineae bacterium]|nr:PAS domain-containing protein [Anaerolineae bacterium]